MKIFKLLNIEEKYRDKIIEIRIRVDSKIILYLLENNIIIERFISNNGKLISNINEGIKISQLELNNIFNTLLEYSLDNYKNEISNGFFTLNDGTRIGISGEVCLENSLIKSFKKITSLNIRIARHVDGCSIDILNEIIKDRYNIYNTLIVSPPMCGKTTIIKDLSLQLSKGCKLKDNILFPMNIGIIDERFEMNMQEIKGDINRIDIISGVNKIIGSELLIRSMNPQVIILDEIGLKDDFESLSRVMNSGVSFIATMHGKDKLEVIRKLKDYRYLFEKIIILSKDEDKKKFFKYEVMENE